MRPLLAMLVVAALATEEPVTADLLADQRVVVAGGTLMVGVRLRLAPHWHVYWRNPGDSGMPPRLTWTLPPGWSAGTPDWPTPRAIATPPFMTYGYENEVLLPVAIAIPADAAAGPARIALRIDWLVCQEECRQGRATRELSVTVGATIEADPAGGAAIAAARAALPRSATAAGWQVEWRGDALHLTAPADGPGFTRPRLLADGDWLIHAADQHPAAAGRTWILTLPVASGATRPVAPSGVVIDESGTVPALALP
jgi:DsbC/DsbD-like thiol-disulfide interchange protein